MKRTANYGGVFTLMILIWGMSDYIFEYSKKTRKLFLGRELLEIMI